MATACNPLECLADKALSIVVFGASGDLAKKKTFPALFELFRQGLLPAHTNIFGYARSALDKDDFNSRVSSFFKVNQKSEDDQQDVHRFLDKCTYVQGQYDGEDDIAKLDAVCAEAERAYIPAGMVENKGTNRAFYFALPPSVFGDVSRAVKSNAMSPSGWNRLIIEKPFGRDLDSSNELSKTLTGLFEEEQIFRCDHFIQKQMVQTLTTLRFANAMYEPLWNAENIGSVIITFKEPIGVEGRGGYFDNIGIVRDVMQNHLLQIMTLIAMEPPRSPASEDIRDAKVELLRRIRKIDPKDVVLGQYVGWEKKEPSRRIIQDGYLDDPAVPNDSHCPTFATIVLHVDNLRWRGVPFIMKAAKATNERKTEIRMQFKPPRASVFDAEECPRNELVMRVQPNEAVYMKLNAKQPGLNDKLVETELDLSFGDRYRGIRVPEAYERLIYEVLLGKREHFVRSDELEEAWKLFTPLLENIDKGEIPLHAYEFGTRGPDQSDELISGYGYIRSETYEWTKQ